MSNTTNVKSASIEVWLVQQENGVSCRVVNEDESTNQLDVDSRSIAGAQAEITGWFISKGYEPTSDWDEQVDGQLEPVGECSRQFKLTAQNA